jgi:hypothetical protein
MWLRRKWAQTTQDASFGAYICFFSLYIVLIIVYRHQRFPPPLKSTATRVKGPNDTTTTRVATQLATINTSGSRGAAAAT